MGRSAVLFFVVAVAAAVFSGACGAAPRGVDVGELQTERRSVEADDAESVRAEIRMALGELNVAGGAGSSLMDADFAYNVAGWRPDVDYRKLGDEGELTVGQRGITEGIPTHRARNEWDVRLNDDVPIALRVQMGGGLGNLDLDSLALTGLDLDMGAGSATVDLTGSWERDVNARIRGGAGELTVLLPSRMGVRVDAGARVGRVNAEGLRRQGDAYVNDAYGGPGANLEVDVEGGIGQINLEVV